DVARRELWWLSNRAQAAVAVTPGVHGLSNALLDTPWPKVAHSTQRLATLLRPHAAPDHAQLLDAMLDTRVADDAALPSTGVGIDTERMLSPAFIRSPRYGTRCTTLVTASDVGAQVTEQSHAHPGQAAQQRQFEWAWQRER
ncbi:MAG: NRDE family protein, partial [Betaproteobacteria bacterium]|nr:NRDE family protein [Betaproteobacteria bacterium]